MGDDLKVRSSGPAAHVQGAKEPTAKERINSIATEVLASKELKDLETILKRQGIDHIEFGDPAVKYDVPFSAKARDAFAHNLATTLDQRIVTPDLKNPNGPPSHNTDLAKSLAKEFLKSQAEELDGRNDLPPAATDVNLTLPDPGYQNKNVGDASQD